MSENIFIGVAWPYANGSLHLGHVAGAYLPADIFARYHRVKGNNVLMVSGSDQHGTPITLRAEQENKSPAEIAGHYHDEFLECWQKLGISFDLFTSTGTSNHASVVHDIFNRLLKQGYLYKDTMAQAYCPNCQRFMPDRYIEGTCPHCQATGARGDQCDECGNTTSPGDLIDPRCRICSATPRFKNTEHYFFKLSAFENDLLKWVKKQTHWRQNVLNFTLGMLQGGLKDRAITRDLEWGVSVPQPGFENKCIYVWFEAVIGYLSASKEWAALHGNSEAWQPFWHEGARSFYFIGKDNIPFHTLIWPSMLMGYGGLILPDNVPANEFLTIEGKRLSTSRNWAVWLPDYLERYNPDTLRYMLSINMPETSDTDFSWREFVRRNNDELVATYGNLVHRVMTFTSRNFDGAVPTPPQQDAPGNELVEKAKAIIDTTDKMLERCSFREAIREAMTLAQEANRYLDSEAPWKAIKQDRDSAARSVYNVLTVLSALKTVLYPFLPFSSEKLHSYLGFDGKVSEAGWQLHLPVAGHELPAPEALFQKLDDSIIEEEMSRLGQ